ncbi:MAG: class B sortase [Lachnospiraceae bacterium]|nr:class B sortase [Lachnospiraceae bacterium]
MGRKIRRTLMIILGAVFLFSVCFIIVVRYEYRANEALYEGAARQYTAAASGDASGGIGGSGPAGGQDDASGQGGPTGEDFFADLPPIAVDFQALQAVNEDVCGWLYCGGTPINYPVLQGEDNDAYLHHSYDKAYAGAGSIFVEALNSRDFADANTIVYGHHMRDGSMFACLDKWAQEGFYESHPVAWLLTPKQDYRIDLFAGYTTSGYSDTYTIFTGPCGELEEYLERSMGQSDFASGIPKEAATDPQNRYVVLSTCAYVFTDARYVLHGVLVPVDSAGGVPFP